MNNLHLNLSPNQHEFCFFGIDTIIDAAKEMNLKIEHLQEVFEHWHGAKLKRYSDDDIQYRFEQSLENMSLSEDEIRDLPLPHEIKMEDVEPLQGEALTISNCLREYLRVTEPDIYYDVFEAL